MPYLKDKTYLNADRSKVVAEDSAEAAWLLGMPGDEISAEEAKRVGAKTTTSEPEPAPAEAEADEADAEAPTEVEPKAKATRKAR